MVPIDRFLTEKEVKRLLDDAERKHKGADFAAELEERFAADQLAEERDALIATAHRMDPHHACEAWDKTVLPTPYIPAPKPWPVDG
jgi:hypothetical protein